MDYSRHGKRIAVTVNSEGNKTAEAQKSEDDRLADRYAEPSIRENLFEHVFALAGVGRGVVPLSYLPFFVAG
jgi:hypothetical protein